MSPAGPEKGALITDQIAPTGYWSSHSANQVVSGTITVTAVPADNDAVAFCYLYIDGAYLATTYGPHQVAVNTKSYANGYHTFQCNIYDRLGHLTVIYLQLNFENAPVVAITSPANGGSYPGTWVYSANVTHYSSGITTRFYIDGGLNNTLGGTSPSYTFDSHYLTAGWHTFQVIATDAQGNVGEQTFSAHVSNTVPGSAWISFGNLMCWWGVEGEEGWYEYRTSPPNEENRWGGTLAWWTGWDYTWWTAFGDLGYSNAYPAHYLPGNPDPTHYQQRCFWYGGYVEGGSEHNTVVFRFYIQNIGEVNMYVNGSTGAVVNVDGGNYVQVLRYATDPGWNSGHTADVRVGYDHVIKAPYNS